MAVGCSISMPDMSQSNCCQVRFLASLLSRGQRYDRFSALVGKYVDIPVLTPTIVNEFIQKIIVHAPDKSSGKRKQQIEIIFNFVGQVDIPILTTPIILEQKPQNRKTA